MPDVLLRIEGGSRVNRPPLVCVICGEPTNQVQELKAGGALVPVPFCHVHIDYTILPVGLVFVPAVLGVAIGALILKIDRSPLVLATGVLVAAVGCLVSFLVKFLLNRRFAIGVVAQHDSPRPTHVLLRGVCPAFADAVEKDRTSSNPFSSSDPSSDNPFQF